MQNTMGQTLYSDCLLCLNTGVVLADKIGYNGHPYAFRCPCAWGNRKNYAYPTWKHSNNHQYKLVVRSYKNRTNEMTIEHFCKLQKMFPPLAEKLDEFLNKGVIKII